MTFSQAPQLVVLLFVFAGALHVLAPDHWLPTSVFAWQKRWRFSKTILFSIFAFFSHVLTGYFLYLIFQKWMKSAGSTQIFSIALGLMFLMMILRGARFSKIREALRFGHQGARGGFAVLSLLGPCEVTVPLFLKAKFLGMGYLIPFAAFLVGTWLAGIVLVLLGQFYWDRPNALVRGVQWSYRKAAVLPMLCGVIINIGFLYFA